MSIVTQIYKAEPTYSNELSYSKDTSVVTFIDAYITINGKKFTGTAVCAPEDYEFSSLRIGKQIALSRARIKALNYFYNESKYIFDGKYQLYRELSLIPNIDMTDKTYYYLRQNVAHAITNMLVLKRNLKQETQHLQEYIHDVNDTFIRIRHHRILEQAKNEQKNRQNS